MWDKKLKEYGKDFECKVKKDDELWRQFMNSTNY